MKWRNSDFHPIKAGEFVKKRFVRLYIPMWILLLMVIPIEYYFAGRFELQTIAFNAIGLGWARPFGSSGHLWYITMTLMLYVAILAFSHIRLDKIRLRWWSVAILVFLTIYFALADKLNTFSEEEPPLILSLGALFYYKGVEIMQITKKRKMAMFIMAIFVWFVSLYLYNCGWHETHKALAALSGAISGMLLLITLNTWIEAQEKNKVSKWLSGISYEMYLVHLPLIPVVGYLIPNTWLMLPVWVIVSFACAVGINQISNRTIK